MTSGQGSSKCYLNATNGEKETKTPKAVGYCNYQSNRGITSSLSAISRKCELVGSGQYAYAKCPDLVNNGYRVVTSTCHLEWE